MASRNQPCYFLAHVQPNAEQRVVDRLRQQRCETYYPRIKVRRSHSRRVDWAYRPFLPRYLFVEDDGRGVSHIKRTQDVCDVVRAGLVPVLVRCDVVDEIKRREVDGFVQLDGLLPKAFRPGQLLHITEGEYAGRDVMFKQMSGATRALVFLHAVIGRVQATLPLYALEANGSAVAA